MPKVSVITICYNEPNLEKTCESIVKQTYQDFEWIVVDGGSNQETLDIFEKYKQRINTFISEKDNGIYNAMNKGIKLAHGEYLNFMNAGDCFYNKDTLQQVIARGLDKDIIYGDRIISGGRKTILDKHPRKISSTFLYRGSLCHQSTFIKKELFDKYGLYNENYKIVSDWEKWIVFILFNHCSYKHVSVIVCNYDLNGISSKSLNLLTEERKRVFAKYFTEKELKKIKKLQRKAQFRQHFWERVFSIKNSADKKRKIITIFGLKIKWKKN